MGLISLIGKPTCVRHIITTIDYLTIWDEATMVKDCTATTDSNFFFENVVTRFGCPKILINDQGTHFVNQLIEELTKEFQIQHRKTMPYHP